MNLVANHYNCTSPMDYISHHTLHSHIPIHHHTNHTAVTNHSFALIASPHLHLILPLTYKQHTYTHPLRSLVFPWLTFPSVFHSLSFRVPPGLLTLSLLIVCCLPYWPRLPTGYPLCLLPALTHCSASVYESVLSTLPSTPLFDICLSDLLFVSIKLQMDLNVTDPSLQKTSPKQRSSGFSKEPWPGMEAFNQLLDLKQGSLPIEEYVTRFYEISCKVPFDEVAFKDIFRFGLNEPIKSCLPAGRFDCSLKDFIDFALLCAGSSLTVGVSEGERNTASETKMADAPEHDRNMSATPESPAKMATKPADAPLRPGLIACVLDAPLVSVRVAGVRSLVRSVPGARRIRSRGRSVPGARRVRSRGRSVPGARRVRSRGRSDPGARRVRSRGRSDPGARRVRSRARSVPGARRVRSRARSIQELEAPDLPWPLKLPASVPETKCALSASCVSVSSRSQSRPGISAPPWRAPAPLWRPPVSSAPPWRAPVSSAPPWRAPVSSAPPWWASVSSAPPWWASVPSAPPWWASVTSAPPWWAPDLPESPHASADLPESPPPTCQSRLRRPARVASRLRRPARVASRLRRPARVSSRPCCLVGPTWTWPSIPSPSSTSAPPPSWIVPCLCKASGSRS